MDDRLCPQYITVFLQMEALFYAAPHLPRADTSIRKGMPEKEKIFAGADMILPCYFSFFANGKG
ncbi:MAG: hypothetical protein HFF78_02305 [Oscillospiraceae bacterium]|nr:hypothetical protein [Oscillospiraceae bacterium]